MHELMLVFNQRIIPTALGAPVGQRKLCLCNHKKPGPSRIPSEVGMWGCDGSFWKLVILVLHPGSNGHWNRSPALGVFAAMPGTCPLPSPCPAPGVRFPPAGRDSMISSELTLRCLLHL